MSQGTIEQYRLDINLAVSGIQALDREDVERIVKALGWDVNTLIPSDTGDPNEWSIEIPDSVAEFVKECWTANSESPDWHIETEEATLFVFGGALVTVP